MDKKVKNGELDKGKVVIFVANSWKVITVCTNLNDCDSVSVMLSCIIDQERGLGRLNFERTHFDVGSVFLYD